MSLSVIVHGGAKEIPAEGEEAHHEGCRAAAEIGWEVLAAGGSAVDAVEAAIRALEDNPAFNAGTGSVLNADGEVEMDAALMEGTHLHAGGVGAVQGLRHPISAARKVMESEFTLLVARGACQFAEEHGLELCDPRDLVHPDQLRQWKRSQAASPAAGRESRGHDTVGCVALDIHGHLACGTSTGGTGKNPCGRIGDSPLVGCGLYADGRLGASSLTGDGEAITRVVLGKTVVDLLRDSRHPEEAAKMAIELLEQRVGGEAGVIVLDTAGRIGWAHNSRNIAVAYRTGRMDAAVSFLSKESERALRVRGERPGHAT